MTPSDMTGRTALVTGAASGLGRGVALALAKAGADIAIVDVNEAGLAETAEAIRALGRQALVRPADISDADTCKAAVAEAVAQFGRLDALCNVAGIILFANAHEMPVVDWNRTIGVNLSGAFFLSQAAIPHLLETDGAIVNVASSAAFIGEAYAAAYCASKGGLVQLTKAMAMEYVGKPIRINAIAPGGMMTNIAANMRLPEGADVSLIKRYSGLRGLVAVEEAANLVAHLASPAAQGFHGACINIDRGITAG